MYRSRDYYNCKRLKKLLLRISNKKIYKKKNKNRTQSKHAKKNLQYNIKHKKKNDKIKKDKKNK